MIELSTDRLSFRKWHEKDFPFFADFYQDPINAKYVGGIKSAEESWRLMATYLGHYELKGFSYLAIETKSTKELIGTVGLWKSTLWPEHELGYWLLPSAQGNGYAVEAGVAVLEYAKKDEFPSLVSYIDTNNEPSIKLALRLGAKLDSTIELLDFGPHNVYRYW